MQHIIKMGSTVLLLTLVLYSCKVEPDRWDPRSENQVITEYVETNEQYSEFYGLLDSTGTSSLLAVRGPFTLFLPNNDAMNAYYTEKGISSYMDLSAEDQTELAMNHIVDAQIEAGGIGLGALPEVNGIGDYLVSEFDGADIIINKDSKIIDRDILTANGVIHQVSKVLDPVKKSVYDVLADDPSYSIFAEGLSRTGLKDTLGVISFPFGKTTARTRFTILAIADTTFQRLGIPNIDALVAKYTNDPDNITDINNGFYRYMEYHCIAETYYLSDLPLGAHNYPVLSYDNYVSIAVDKDYKINIETSTGEYTHFIIDKSNIPGKNGTIHSVNKLLPVVQPAPAEIRWETTDHFDLKQLDCFQNTYGRFFDGQNDFEDIKWEGSYLLYYFKLNQFNLLHDDMLSMQGWFWCEVTTPKIMKGHYKLTGNIWNNWVDYAVYVDGVNTALVKKSDPANTTLWGEFNFTKTERHKIRILATSPGILFWDYVTFTPIN